MHHAECHDRPATMCRSSGCHAFSFGNIKQLDSLAWSSTSHGPASLKFSNLHGKRESHLREDLVVIVPWLSEGVRLARGNWINDILHPVQIELRCALVPFLNSEHHPLHVILQ
jgi:hypothetical protein